MVIWRQLVKGICSVKSQGVAHILEISETTTFSENRIVISLDSNRFELETEEKEELFNCITFRLLTWVIEAEH